jgi:hypothetical protein
MGAGFPLGHRGLGPLGDPDPDSLLPEAIAEAILDDRPLDGRVLRGPLPAEIRPLVETVGALRAAPTAAELRGHAQAMAAFREVSGSSGSAGLARTLQLEVPHHRADRRARRARHRAPGRTRPVGHQTAKRLALTVAGAAALFVILGLIAYSGYLPGPFQRAAHVATGGSAAKRSSSAAPSRLATGPGGLAGSSATPAASPTPSSTPTPTTKPSAAGRTAAKLCQAYFSDPLRDMIDFRKLSMAAGGPLNVLRYCQPYLSYGQIHWPPGTSDPQGSGYGDGSDSNNGNGSVGGSNATSGPGPGGTGNTSSSQHAW